MFRPFILKKLLFYFYFNKKMSQGQPIEWIFKKPKVCTPPSPAGKLFALTKPYFGPRLNKASLRRPITEKDIKKSRGLAALATPIPPEFSWRKSAPDGQLEPSRDQGYCGNCWSMATCSVLGDRYSKKYNIPSPAPSSMHLMTLCYDLFDGFEPPKESCNIGGDPYMAAVLLTKSGKGVKEEMCWPFSLIADHNYTSPDPPLPDNCCYTCCDTSSIIEQSNVLFTVEPGSVHSLVSLDNQRNVDVEGTIAAIQREIMANGPVVVGFNVYRDFMDYWQSSAPSGGIYVCGDDSEYNLDGGHAVSVTGWGTGTINGKKVRYWEMRNSWGQTGDGGYCKIAFSADAPINASLQFDIPGPPGPGQGNEWTGGMVSFMPGPLPKSLSSGGQPVVTSQPQPVNPQPQPEPQPLVNPLPIDSSQQTICFPFAKAKELMKHSEEVLKRKATILGVDSNTLLIIVGSIIGFLVLVLVVLFIINMKSD